MTGCRLSVPPVNQFKGTLPLLHEVVPTAKLSSEPTAALLVMSGNSPTVTSAPTDCCAVAMPLQQTTAATPTLCIHTRDHFMLEILSLPGAARHFNHTR